MTGQGGSPDRSGSGPGAVGGGPRTRTGWTSAMLGPRDDVLDEILRRSLLTHRMRTIQVDDATGRALQMLASIHRPRRIIEIGALFGYSAIYLARGLPEGGTLTTLEIDPEAAALAAMNLEKAGLGEKAEVVVADACDYLRGLPAESVDMIFIDGAKLDYPSYLRHAFPALRVGGLLVADDALGDGDYSRESESGSDDSAEQIAAIRSYARAACRSPKLFTCAIPVGNGLLVSLKAAAQA